MEEEKLRLYALVEKTGREHKEAVQELVDLMTPITDKMIAERDLEGLNKLVSEVPDSWYSLRLYRMIGMVEQAIMAS